MFAFLRVHQLDIMIALSSICAVIAFFTAITKTLPKHRKRVLILMEVCASIWLEADRISYLSPDYPADMAYYAVRISNFFVFLMTVVVLYSVNLYIEDVFENEGGMKPAPLLLRIGDILAYIAIFLVVVSVFTGLYYTVDEANVYHRSDLYFISYIFPYLILMFEFITLIRYRKKVQGRIAFSIFVFDGVCLLASLVQLFAYGISIVDMAAVLMVIGLYVFALVDMNEKAEIANRHLIETLKGEKKRTQKVFEQTAVALVTAIDARHKFTRGHSARVAGYAKQIAQLSGMDERTCDEVFYAALLHDVGKVELPDAITNNASELTTEEHEILRQHAGLGAEILSSITEIPFLSAGANYHHERFDGTGYP